MAVAVVGAAGAEPAGRAGLGAVRAHPTTRAPAHARDVVTVTVVLAVASTRDKQDRKTFFLNTYFVLVL